MTQQVGILGSGTVAKSLGSGFLKYGYSVMLGTRSPEKLQEWKQEQGEKSHVGSFDEAAKFGDLLVLAVKGTVTSEALELAGADHLKHKILIDATNPIAENEPENGVLSFFTTMQESLMERLQKEYPSTRFVKAFNSVGSHLMVNPQFKEGIPTMFTCGNDQEAKQKVHEIIRLFGWEYYDMGGVEAARAIEPLCMLWCIPGFRENKWTHAFKLLEK